MANLEEVHHACSLVVEVETSVYGHMQNVRENAEHGASRVRAMGGAVTAAFSSVHEEIARHQDEAMEYADAILKQVSPAVRLARRASGLLVKLAEGSTDFGLHQARTQAGAQPDSIGAIGPVAQEAYESIGGLSVVRMTSDKLAEVGRLFEECIGISDVESDRAGLIMSNVNDFQSRL